MDYRKEAFTKKFAGAAQHLGVRPEQVVSLKLRENVSSYQEYRDLVQNLENEEGIQCSEIDANLQGRGYLLGDGNTKVIVVEHETGLEVLYIAGSIASLIGLVPLVLQGWHALRGRFFERHAMAVHGVEIRRMNERGELHEDRVHSLGLASPASLGLSRRALVTTASLIENEITSITRQLQLVVSRVERLEQQLRMNLRSAKHKTAGTIRHPAKRKKKVHGA